MIQNKITEKAVEITSATIQKESPTDYILNAEKLKELNDYIYARLKSAHDIQDADSKEMQVMFEENLLGFKHFIAHFVNYFLQKRAEEPDVYTEEYLKEIYRCFYDQDIKDLRVDGDIEYLYNNIYAKLMSAQGHSGFSASEINTSVFKTIYHLIFKPNEELKWNGYSDKEEV